MRVHVIRTVLRIVFEHEDRRLLPVAALRDGFYQPAERDIVLGDHGAWRWILGPRTGRVISSEPDDAERGQPAGALELAELFEPDIDAAVVRNGQVERRILRMHKAL